MRSQLGAGIFTIDAVLTASECRAYIEWSEGLGYEAAPVSLAGGAVHRPDLRNNARVVVESRDRVEELWRRVVAYIPPMLEERPAVGLNERMRFYRYGPGQRFAWHTDGCFRRPNGEESLLTFMVYLNSGAEGGETCFEKVSVRPRQGLALVFDHYLPHEGAVVTAGQKYVLRSDVMYGPVRTAANQRLQPTAAGGMLEPPRLNRGRLGRQGRTTIDGHADTRIANRGCLCRWAGWRSGFAGCGCASGGSGGWLCRYLGHSGVARPMADRRDRLAARDRGGSNVCRKRRTHDRMVDSLMLVFES